MNVAVVVDWQVVSEPYTGIVVAVVGFCKGLAHNGTMPRQCPCRPQYPYLWYTGAAVVALVSYSHWGKGSAQFLLSRSPWPVAVTV